MLTTLLSVSSSPTPVVPRHAVIVTLQFAAARLRQAADLLVLVPGTGIGQPINLTSVQKLQTALHAKAKAEAGYRFYALYDKISRADILAHATPSAAQQGRNWCGRFCGHRSVWVQLFVGRTGACYRGRRLDRTPSEECSYRKPTAELRLLTLRDMTAAVLVLEPILEADTKP
jgi:hypothetical protein